MPSVVGRRPRRCCWSFAEPGPATSVPQSQAGTTRARIDLNREWLFFRGYTPGAERRDFGDAITADGRDLSFVTVQVVDDAGQPCPLASNIVRFTIAGPGTIAAVDNGDPATTEPFQAVERALFNGLALAIVRSTAGTGGTIRLDAASQGLAPASIEIATGIR